MRSIIFAVIGLAIFVFFVMEREVWAQGAAECSSATQRAAMEEYDYMAENMLGIPSNSPLSTMEKQQYVAAICLHTQLKQGL